MECIARADVEDAEVILALQRRAYESEARLYDDWSLPPLTQTLDELRAELRVATVLKLVRQHAIVGSVRATQVGAVWQIGRLIVDPALQRQGLGSKLLQAIERQAPAGTLMELFTGSRSEGNLRLYQRHGYRLGTARVLSPQVTLLYLTKCAGMDGAVV